MMQNVFLDLGTHFGQGLREFIQTYKMDSSWIIHTFEANSFTYKTFIDEHHKHTPWVIAHNQAISDHNGVISFNVESFSNGEKNGMGSSVVDLKDWKPWGNDAENVEHFQEKIEVTCIDLSEFIINNFNPDDNIIIKMDIEGSEYDTLERMIETGAMSYVNSINIEWHSRYFKNREEIQKRQEILLEKLKTYNMELGTWI